MGTGGIDIPVARRSSPVTPQRRFRFRQSLATATLVLVGSIGLAWLFREPIKRQLAPPPVRGINARQGLDGRLLGHFPYPEARSSELVDAAPGIALQRDAADSFLAMQRAAAAEGVSLRLLSGFRSLELQKHLSSMWARNATKAPNNGPGSAPPRLLRTQHGLCPRRGRWSQDWHEPQPQL
jgi:D-alanyl-D-alanine carboxypeptidase